MMNLQRNAADFGQDIFALPASRPHLRHAARRAFGTVWTWMERSRQRRALADLDDRLLEDVGISRSQVSREIAKPFWR